jgi:alpha-L-fucosidase
MNLAPSRHRFLLLAIVIAAAASGGEQASAGLTAEQRDFQQWRFGMFIHFNLGTFTDLDWAGGYEDPARFNPARLDCTQWADAAKAAGMTYLVLTVKHTEGMALYDSAVTDHDITRCRNFRGGRGDIVREFVDACRSRGLKVGLYRTRRITTPRRPAGRTCTVCRQRPPVTMSAS